MNFVFVCPESEDVRFSVERRCIAPARVINRTGRYNADLIGWKEFVLNSTATQSLLEQSDFIILHRGLWSPVLPGIQHWKARDKNIIADFIDPYQLMDEDELADFHDMETNDGLAANSDKYGLPGYLTQFKWTLQSTSGGTTPSQRLCDDWNPYTKMVILPDYVDLERLSLISPEAHETINLGWRGSIRQFNSLKTGGVLMALEAACQMRSNIRVVLSVDHPEAVGKINLPSNQVEIINWKQNNWHKTLGRIDIGLAPMIGESGQRASLSPIMDFMALQIPWIASQGPAVYDLQSYGWIVENTAEGWLKAIIEMVDHLEDFRAEASAAPYLYAISKSLEENIQNVVDTYVRMTGSYSTRPLTPVSIRTDGDHSTAK